MKTIEILGWPVAESQLVGPDLQLGDEPLIGRLACPSLTRLNLKRRESETLLLRALEFAHFPNGATNWRLEIRRGVHWWSGDEVRAKDLVRFIEKNLAAIVKQKSEGLWDVPPYTLEKVNEYTVRIRWEKTPVYGPYIFNGVSLARDVPTHADGAGPHGYECTGVYRLDKSPVGYSLSPSKGYRFARPKILLHLGNTKPGAGTKVLEFRQAKGYRPMPTDKDPNNPHYAKAVTCQHSVDLPLLTAISWNMASPVIRDGAFRKAMTQLTPRGELLREGALSLGNLLSGPIPRNHPGYNESVLIRPFNIQSGSELLDALHYTKATPAGFRLDKAGQPLEIKLVSTADDLGLVEKVLLDAFNTARVQLTISHAADEGAAQKADGVLTGIYLPWPEVNLIGSFHSASKSTFPAFSPRDSALDDSLVKYSRTITEKRPDFTLLEEVHKRLFDIEPMTVLLQHKACVEVRDLPNPGPIIDIKDPDWFRKVIL